MKYSEKAKVTMHKTDFRGVVRPSAILEYMQDAANMQMKIYHPSNEELWAQGKAYILSRLSINYYNDIETYDDIETITWANKSAGYVFNRSFRIMKGTERIAEAKTVWAFIDAANKKLLKVSDFKSGFDIDDEELDDEFNLRVKIPCPEKLHEIGTYTVTYSDIDRNHHMNNTKYPDMIFHFAKMYDKRMKKVSVSFLNEGLFNDEMKIYGYTENEIFYLRSVRSDGKINIEAEAEFKDI